MCAYLHIADSQSEDYKVPHSQTRVFIISHLTRISKDGIVKKQQPEYKNVTKIYPYIYSYEELPSFYFF